MMKRVYYTYVLISSRDKRWYTGSTNDLRKRLKEHGNKKVYATKDRGPLELIYYEACPNDHDAQVREIFKNWDGKTFFKEQIKAFPISNGLNA